MNRDLTEIVFILDRSGSMAGLEGDTIGGFNAMVEKQKKEPGTALLSAVLFSDDSEVVYDRVDVRAVEPMTEQQYRVGGCTALLDAIGGAVRHIANVHKYAREEDIPEHTIFVITTDGMENASRIYSSEKVKKMVSKKTEKNGWEFLYLAANIDAVETGAAIGIKSGRAANYKCDEMGTGMLYETVCEAVGSMRKGSKISANWADRLEADSKRR